jgi:hypothetical protein
MAYHDKELSTTTETYLKTQTETGLPEEGYRQTGSF